MKQQEKNYYRILGIMPEASEKEVEEAYKRVKTAYTADSVAAYSLFSQKEKEDILEKITLAYETLKDPEKRNAYNAHDDNSHQEDYQDLLDLSDEDSIGVTEKADKKAGKTFEESIGNKVFFKAGEPKKYGINLKQPLIVMNDKNPIVSEQYRVLYTKLDQISLWRSYKTYAVTSAVQGEGKTVTSLNLAYIIAHEFKKKVILVECDFKRPSICSYFNSEKPEYDFIDVIKGEVELQAAIIQLENSNLFLLPVREGVKNSSKLLGTSRMKETLDTLKAEFDYIIIDSPPILALADMNVLSKIVDGIILVVKAGKTPKDMVLKAVKSLPVGDVVGIVLNAVDFSFKKYYYHYYS